MIFFIVYLLQTPSQASHLHNGMGLELWPPGDSPEMEGRDRLLVSVLGEINGAFCSLMSFNDAVGLIRSVLETFLYLWV